jgi:predicted RNA-binding Zn-ribbon protein involved in translation (DUF1610 family)
MQNKRTNVELSDVLKSCSKEIQTNFNLHPVQLKALKDIIACRTSVQGGHKYTCHHCGYNRVAYNSCRNRHCPKCQYLKQAQWIDKLGSRVLPGRYFHIVFTLPEQLNKLFYLNQTKCYNLLFSSSWYAIKEAGLNPSFLGAKMGAISVLHTWGQTLTYHPHIHMLVPAGGLSSDNMEWITASKNFLLPVKALSSIYRGVMFNCLSKLINQNQLILPDNIPDLKMLKKSVYEKKWNVYAKKPFGAVNGVLQYLGRYVHRVGISNDRLLSYTKDKVSFGYKDYRDNNKKKAMTLNSLEFSRRFLQHILPNGFYKIRYFGILSTALIDSDKSQALALIGESIFLSKLEGLTVYELIRKLFRIDPIKCPKCKESYLRITKLHVQLE